VGVSVVLGVVRRPKALHAPHLPHLCAFMCPPSVQEAHTHVPPASRVSPAADALRGSRPSFRFYLCFCAAVLALRMLLQRLRAPVRAGPAPFLSLPHLATLHLFPVFILFVYRLPSLLSSCSIALCSPLLSLPLHVICSLLHPPFFLSFIDPRFFFILKFLFFYSFTPPIFSSFAFVSVLLYLLISSAPPFFFCACSSLF
jgi:hypothetical protein